MPAICKLARFLHLPGMDLVRTNLRNMPIEDWVDQMSRLTLVVLLLATLGCVVI
jgi:hypothetical protein